MYVLRKTFGAWSTGTAVRFGLDGIFYIGDEVVPEDMVVKRRDMTRYGPAINSKEKRRREKEVKKALGIDAS